MQTTDESMVPLLINCWPSASGGESYVNIEYESTTDFDLQNVAIAIPLPALAASPKVNQVLAVSLAPICALDEPSTCQDCMYSADLSSVSSQ